MQQQRPVPLPDAERAGKTENLIAAKASDIERWSEFTSLATQWDARAQRAAAHIPDHARVLDIGCGAMALRLALKPGCAYFPADIVERAPGCRVVDLNRQEFPEGSYDWVTFLGVLEYIHDPAWPLRMSHRAAPHLLLTYCVDITGGAAIAQRRGMGWVNDLNLDGMRALLHETGWRINAESLDKQGPHNHQMMFVCGKM